MQITLLVTYVWWPNQGLLRISGFNAWHTYSRVKFDSLTWRAVQAQFAHRTTNGIVSFRRSFEGFHHTLTSWGWTAPRVLWVQASHSKGPMAHMCSEIDLSWTGKTQPQIKPNQMRHEHILRQLLIARTLTRTRMWTHRQTERSTYNVCHMKPEENTKNFNCSANTTYFSSVFSDRVHGSCNHTDTERNIAQIPSSTITTFPALLQFCFRLQFFKCSVAQALITNLKTDTNEGAKH